MIKRKLNPSLLPMVLLILGLSTIAFPLNSLLKCPIQ